MILKLSLVRPLRFLILLAAGFMTLATRPAAAEPYLAVQQGYKCVQCHVNPTGGGMRNSFGLIFAENALPMQTLPPGSPVWLGQVVQDIIRVGGDLRTEWFHQSQPGSSPQQAFQLEQLRLYADVEVIPNLLGIYVDEQVGPDAQNLEAYGRYGNPTDWYIKAGRFYLPFGWRLQDNLALPRVVTDINMFTPDTGVEFGLERGPWSAQLDLTNGAVNTGAASGYQVSTNVVRTMSSWRVGAAADFTDSHEGDVHTGNKTMFGLYSGVRTGPVEWLREIDLVRQAGFHQRSLNPNTDSAARRGGLGLPSGQQSQAHLRVLRSGPHSNEQQRAALQRGVRTHSHSISAAACRFSPGRRKRSTELARTIKPSNSSNSMRSCSQC